MKCLVRACSGCSLSNITQTRSSDLVYGFPTDTPICVLFVDIYSAGADLNFNGFKHYLIAACGMTAFGICEPTIEQTAEVFAAALMKIWPRFGFSPTIVVDKASAFLGVFSAAATLLNINIHVLSGKNHDPMIVECLPYHVLQRVQHKLCRSRRHPRGPLCLELCPSHWYQHFT